MTRRATNSKARMNRALVLPVVGVALIAALVLGAGPSTAGKPKPPSWALHGSYAPKIDPANFVAAVDNRYFPLKPGTAFHYQGFKGKTPQIDDMVVTRQTIRILGVTCTVVRDTVSQHGKPLERTFDWYAQDKQGNVWYMGEAPENSRTADSSAQVTPGRLGSKEPSRGSSCAATRSRTRCIGRSITRPAGRSTRGACSSSA